MEIATRASAWGNGSIARVHVALRYPTRTRSANFLSVCQSTILGLSHYLKYTSTSEAKTRTIGAENSSCSCPTI